MVIIGIVAIAILAVGIFAYLNYGSGTMQIWLTDPPSGWGSASQVYINYTLIELHRADAGNESGWINFTSTGGFLNLTSFLDVNKTLGSGILQTGTYNLIRFKILSAKVTVASVNYTASVPPEKLQIAITKGGIKVNTLQTSNLLIELDITVEGTAPNFVLVPDVRAVPMQTQSSGY